MLKILSIFLLSFFMFGPANAQNYNAIFDELSELNRIPPLQNPEFTETEKILSRKILDRKNRTVGEVRDVIVNQNGSINALAIEFDRLGLPADVFLNYRNNVERPASRGYILTLDDDQLEERFASFLANTETAAGREDIISIKSVRGAIVENASGKRIGEMRDILFTKDGSSVSTGLIEITTGFARGELVAIPYRLISWQDKSSRKQKTAIISDDTARAVMALAE